MMQRPLTIVAGKGGVGRSTVASALALNAAAAGGRVLVVDAINDGGLAAALGSAEPTSGPGSIELLELTPELALDEYLKLFLKVPVPASRIKPISRIFDYVATAAPGVREILSIGKIAWEVKEGNWDAVVVDGPATGHIIELLAAPATLRQLISVGPLAGQTEWIAKLLANQSTTGVVLATTSEDLPVAECLELVGRVQNETAATVSGIVVTRVPSLLGRNAKAEAQRLMATEPVDPALAEALAIVVGRSDGAETQLGRIAEVNLPTVRVGESSQPVAAARQALSVVEV